MAKDDDPQLYASGYERNRLDRYWTNPWMTEELRKQVKLPRPIWEPAAGRGDMSRALGGLVYSSDIDISEFDTSKVPVMPSGERCRAIITNPPYSEPRKGIADEFIRHGLDFFEDDGIAFMALLLRSEFRSAKTRFDIFGGCPHYKGELVLTTRPRWDYGDPDAPENASPRHNFSWFLWEKDWIIAGENAVRRPVQLFSYTQKGFKT
jgi:hypothetical protein